MLPRDDSPGAALLLCWVCWDPDTEWRGAIQVISSRTGSNRAHHQMQHSEERDTDSPVKSTRRIRLPPFGRRHRIKLSVLVPVVFAADVIVAILAWFVVGLLIR